VHFETDTLCCGENDLYVYDRGMVSGSIPFTRFILDHENVSRVRKSLIFKNEFFRKHSRAELSLFQRMIRQFDPQFLAL
jgi:hypothetical protein